MDLISTEKPASEPANEPAQADAADGFAGRIPAGAAITVLLVALALLCGLPSSAAAQDAPGADGSLAGDAAPAPPQGEPGWFPAWMWVVPGALLHGSGTYASGDHDAGLALLAGEGLGIAAIAAGMTTIALTGASRRVVGPAAAVTVQGVGLFAITWLADLYGAAVGADGFGEAPGGVRRADVQAGYRFIDDPIFAYRSLVHVAADLRLAGWRLSPSGYFAADDDNQRVRLVAAWRPWGPTIGEPRDDGSFVDVASGVVYHNFGTDGFDKLVLELQVEGRLDLAGIGRSLSGSFAEAGLGWGIEIFDYDVAGLDFGEDIGELLLGGFGFGVYLGSPDGTHGEATLYYDHRHDDFAAGLGVGGLGGGVAGHFGLQGHLLFGPRAQDLVWGVGWELEVGSAYIAGLDLRVAFGGPR